MPGKVSPKITPWEKREPFYISEPPIIGCSYHYFILNNTALFREDTLSPNTLNRCKIQMFRSEIGEL